MYTNFNFSTCSNLGKGRKYLFSGTSFQFSSVQSLSPVRLCATPWTATCQAPLSMGFSRQEYWSGLPFPPPGNLPDPGIKTSPQSPALKGGFFTTSTTWKVKGAQLCPTLCDPMDYTWNSLGQNTGMGSLSLLQGIFPTQGSNPGLLHCRRILYQLSHKGSPRIVQWVAFPFSSRSSLSRKRTRVSCIAGGLFTNWAIRSTTWAWQQKRKYRWPGFRKSGSGEMELIHWLAGHRHGLTC